MNTESKNYEECNVFRDLYKAYSYDEVEDDTLKWMKSHEEKCDKCRKWIKNVREELNEDSDDMQCIKKAKIIMSVGIGIVIFYAIWISIWLFI